jgi:integrase
MGRVNAISNTKWSQIDWDECVVTNVLEKEGKTVDFFFSEDTKMLIKELKEHREKNNVQCDYIFISKYEGQYKQASVSALWDWTKKIGNMIGVPSLHPHDFRHSGAQLLNLAGMPVEEISNLLNHEGLDVTRKHYLKQDKKKIQQSKNKYKYL